MSRKWCICGGLYGFDPDHPAHFEGCPWYRSCDQADPPCGWCDWCTWNLIKSLNPDWPRSFR